MKSIILGISLIIWNYIACQDIVFPNETETFHISENPIPITERVPINASECPKNMLLHPGPGSKSTWVCDCAPGFLYVPSNNFCYEPYRQGPCSSWNYLILPENQAVPACVENPCIKDGLVPYNGSCYPLKTESNACPSGKKLEVNKTTFKLECTTEIVPLVLIVAPDRCPTGSRRVKGGLCKPVISEQHYQTK
ncbi:uncharacterized protein LOC143179517 [Calliopsis andreniformis]|uniref:uncharacterized protein LOC143179517 n=1 Tax=Calliopsis andreniformis TaxID=337506 RepID=UPI003FCCDE58